MNSSPLNPVDRVVVRPALKEWAAAKYCQLLRETMTGHGELVMIRITPGPDWWSLDDVTRDVVGAVQERRRADAGLWLGWDSRTLIAKRYLAGIAEALDAAGALRRLEVWAVPDALNCTHARCGVRGAFPVRRG